MPCGNSAKLDGSDVSGYNEGLAEEERADDPWDRQSLGVRCWRCGRYKYRRENVMEDRRE